MNELRMKLKRGQYLKQAIKAAVESRVPVSTWESEEIELAFEAGYRAGHAEGMVDATRKESPTLPEGPEAA